MLLMITFELTSRATSGANIPPIRPEVEHKPTDEVRTEVENNSAVYE